MCRFIETICVEDGRAQRLAYHNARLNATRKQFWPGAPEVDLASLVDAKEAAGRIRCRVTYAEQVLGVEYFPYHVRSVRNLKLVEADDVDYRYKYADRTVFDALMRQRGEADEVLIVRRGLLTDTSFTNIALWDGEHWFTPARPLLEGTKRQFLLDRGILIPADIPFRALASYRCISLFNAMLRLGEVVLPCGNIMW